MSAVSVAPSSSKNWWQMKQPSSVKSSQGLSFNSLVSAIGFKSKKLPALTIQEPPLRIRTPLSPPISAQPRPVRSPTVTSRPPSKSVSSTRSRGDSIGPVTPRDTQRDPLGHRGSLFTLSDVDPFAAQSISMHHAHLDPNRISSYSNGSMNDPGLKSDLKTSYSSPHLQIEEFSPLSSGFTSPVLSPRASSIPFVDMGMDDNYKERNRHSQPETSPKVLPPMRARGMTESASRPPPILRDPFPKTEPSSPYSSQGPYTPPLSSRSLSRSVSRVGQPATAPPSHDLPAPPPPKGSPELDLSFSDNPVLTSPLDVAFEPTFSLRREASTTSQFSSNSKLKDVATKPSDLAPFTRKHEVEHHNSIFTSPKGVKKVLSDQMLPSHGRPTTSYSTSPTSSEPLASEKVVRKQRSFHHPRIPMPSIPLPLRNSSSSSVPQLPQQSQTSEVLESRRGSASGPSTPSRKRLFSSSSIRRTSISQGLEEDAQSISIRPSTSPSKSSVVSPSNANLQERESFWDEGRSVHETKSLSNDYAPQQIMSPAELLQVEASMEAIENLTRKRGMSVVSTSTFASNEVFDNELSVTSVIERVAGILTAPPTRSESLMRRPTRKPSSISSRRPSTASTPLSPSSPRSDSGIKGLPIPPRSWTRSTSSANSDGSQPLAALPPPPRQKSKRKPTPKSSQVSLRRQSLMRKPSFLDIGDEGDDSDHTQTPPVESSFLDLARESLDTVLDA